MYVYLFKLKDKYIWVSFPVIMKFGYFLENQRTFFFFFLVVQTTFYVCPPKVLILIKPRNVSIDF